MKACTICGKEKSLEEFHAQKNGAQGRRGACRLCHAVRKKEYQRGNPRQHAATKQWRYRESTPAWADREALVRFYMARPKGMTVDHIVPIKGETVSGLHVAANLQYLTPAENKAKGNKWESKK